MREMNENIKDSVAMASINKIATLNLIDDSVQSPEDNRKKRANSITTKNVACNMIMNGGMMEVIETTPTKRCLFSCVERETFLLMSLYYNLSTSLFWRTQLRS